MKGLSIVFAILAPELVRAASLTSFCLTYYDSTSTSPVPTNSYSATTTSTRTVTSTSTPVSTIIPPSATATKTVTSTVKTTTTQSKVTGTYTSTTTFTATATTTSTSTTVVTTTATSTTTDRTPATATPSPDFIPLQAELTPGGYSNFVCPSSSSPSPSPSQFVARGLRDLFGRNPNAEPAIEARATSTGPLGTSTYPASVGCTTLYYATATSTSVVTATTTSTKSLKQGTITSTTTATTTSTVTKVPSTVKLTVVSTTTTSTATVTAVATSTTTTTTTTTAYQPSSTYYPACQSNNIVQCVNGYQASNPHFVYNLFTIDGPTDAASCCVACNMNQGCGGSLYYIPDNACYGVIDDQCEGNNSFASFQVQPGNYYPIALSNSNCGRFGVRAPDQ